jgi:predicted metal-binding protein
MYPVMERLVAKALELGAADPRLIPVEMVPVEDDIVELCLPPQCDGYDMCANCPPHVMSPSEFREVLKGYESALVFKIEAPMELLLSDERDHVGRLVQETAAKLERFAVESGFGGSRALAGDCCKRLFCNAYERCNVLSGGGECRNPDKARTSMSGLGVNFNKLNRELGWQMSESGEGGGETMGWMAGMVLIGD